MRTVQDKLRAELAAAEKTQVKHRVEGYRRTDSAAALLSSVRDRHNASIRWRKDVLSILGDRNAKQDWVVLPRTAGWVGKKYKVYSVDGKDVAVIITSNVGTQAVNLEAKGETLQEYFSHLPVKAVQGMRRE